MSRFGLLLFLLALVGCPGPNGGVPMRPWGEGGGGSILLRTNTVEGERIRTRKRMVVREQLPRGDLATVSVDESYVQVARRVEVGRPVHVIRRYERYETSVARPGAEPVIENGPLEGSEIELIERVAGVSARVLSGRAEAGQLTGMLINGFESKLLPADRVRVGQQWQIDATRDQDMAGVFRALGMAPTRSIVTCLLVSVAPGERAVGDDLAKPPPTVARVSIDWTLVGAVLDRNETFRLSGELVFDLEKRMVTRLELGGGRVSPGGMVAQQIGIELTREVATGWWE